MGEFASVTELIQESASLEQSGEIAQALTRARQAVELARAQDDLSGSASALIREASVRYRLGQYDSARALAEQASTLAPSDSSACANALLVLGGFVAETGSLEAAESFFHRAADLGRELGDHSLRMNALHSLAAAVYVPRGQFDLALSTDEEAYRIAHEHVRTGISFPLVTLAWIGVLTGQWERTRAALDEIKQVAQPGSVIQGFHYLFSGMIAQEEGDFEAARSFYGQSRSIAESIGEPGLSILLRLGLARCERTVSNAALAYEWASDAVTWTTRTNNRRMLGRALIERGYAAWLNGDPNAAERDLRAAIKDLEARQVAFDLSRARLVLAALLHSQQRDETPAVLCDAAHGIISGGYAFLLEQERALAFPLIAAFLNSSDTTLASACANLVGHLMRVSPAPLRVVTLGSFGVWQGRRVIPQRALRRHAGELFALLLLNPSHMLSSEQFYEALCPDQEPEAAKVLFHHATSALRRALEPDLPDKFPSRYLQVEEGRVTLPLPPTSSVDFESFERHCQRGEWEQALAIYGGEFLPEYLYAEWTTAPRLRLMQFYQRALLAIADKNLAEGLFHETLAACRRVLAIEPWQERAVLLGMRACLGLNDRAGARRLYRNLEKSLRDELQTEPQEELLALYSSLTSRRRKQ